MLMLCWLFIGLTIADFKDKSLLQKSSVIGLDLFVFRSFFLQSFLCKIHGWFVKITLPSLAC